MNSVGGGVASIPQKNFWDTTAGKVTKVAGLATAGTVGMLALTKVINGTASGPWKVAGALAALAGVALLTGCTPSNPGPSSGDDPISNPQPRPNPQPIPVPVPVPVPRPHPVPGPSDGDDPVIYPNPVPGPSDGDDPVYKPYVPGNVYDPDNPHGYVFPTGDVNCDDISGDFADWLMEVGPSYTGVRDKFGLDRDNDGFACESKPRGTDPILTYGPYDPTAPSGGYQYFDPENPHGYEFPQGDVNCNQITGDFADWLMEVGPSYTGERDAFGLDADNDGFACEDKPRGTDPVLYYRY